ncbi:hypothetical protein [Kribbella italica]|uniref:Peptidase inhibitor family I36 n=1 Tax=Kribbella italica TaxID=1540520 RepID=A0A7W9JAU0_9ACTN|nr:hypothetical protein [Kribbella italica]MBB5838494.1 hypothetical protein [Kribbella italica]
MSKVLGITKRVFAVAAGVMLLGAGVAGTASAAPAPTDPRSLVGAGGGEAVKVSGEGMAVAATPPAGCVGIYTSWGATCFQWDGDDQWVVDLDANGWTTVAGVDTNYGKERDCAAPAAADGWKECKYDHREGTCVRFFLYEKKSNGTLNRVSAYSPWYSTSNGARC